ncbi:hypothetical protein BFP72_14145 [Reichenbachiella sp. 5M10]|uniref:T9SS type A sorting domain-containing protein n=1 Tax=Reichenbachiella sp. 5M10 TaxID=1889772 RepID=UPI000C15316C|nr:T9SS type A sorting domain-containing protein [Reichenbachiella sp. 5M10]PIB36455.1 hypothetical protein BFP72_14145 [Reichenbachiella sp. 5M10]
MKTKGVILGLILSSVVFVSRGQSTDSAPVYASNSETGLYQEPVLQLDNQIDIYPNPSVEFVIINIKNSTLRDVSFQLHSVIGNTVTVEAEKIAKDRFKIDLRTFSSGYYFLIIEDELSQFKQAHKFLKK